MTACQGCAGAGGGSEVMPSDDMRDEQPWVPCPECAGSGDAADSVRGMAAEYARAEGFA